VTHERRGGGKKRERRCRVRVKGDCGNGVLGDKPLHLCVPVPSELLSQIHQWDTEQTEEIDNNIIIMHVNTLHLAERIPL